MWNHISHANLEAIPSGAAALGPPEVPVPQPPSPLKEPEDVNWDAAVADGIAAAMGMSSSSKPSSDRSKALAALRRCRPNAEQNARSSMEAALDPNAMAYATAAASSSTLDEGQRRAAVAHAAKSSRERSPSPSRRSLASSLPHRGSHHPRTSQASGCRSEVSVESEAPETALCGMPDVPGLQHIDQIEGSRKSQGLLASWVKWLTPLIGRSDQHGSDAMKIWCGNPQANGQVFSRNLSRDFEDMSAAVCQGCGHDRPTNEAAHSHQQAPCATDGPPPPPPPPPPPQMYPQASAPAEPPSIGPLGVPVANRQRTATLSAIYELPAQYSSATYDDISSMILVSSGEAGTSATSPDVQADMPDPVLLGLTPGEDLALPPCGMPCGLGHVRRGHVGPVGKTPAVLVTELELPRPLDTCQRKRVHTALRASIVARGDLSAPLGVVPARIERGGAGIWVAWLDPLGAAERAESNLMPAWMQHRPLSMDHHPAAAAPCARPLHEALRNGSSDSDWRLKVARQLVSAVFGLHRAGKCHGSLSPCSIWAASDGSVSLLEAGLVDVLINYGVLYEHELLTYMGVDVARYASPQCWEVPRRTGPNATTASDIWALGMILLELFGGAGSPHAECKTMQHLKAKILPKRGQNIGQRVSTSGDYGQLAQSTRRTIEACLSTCPESRPTAEQILFSLAAPTAEVCTEPCNLTSAALLLSETVSRPEAAEKNTVDADNIRDKLASLKVYGGQNTSSSSRTTSVNASSGHGSGFASVSSSISQESNDGKARETACEAESHENCFYSGVHPCDSRDSMRTHNAEDSRSQRIRSEPASQPRFKDSQLALPAMPDQTFTAAPSVQTRSTAASAFGEPEIYYSGVELFPGASRASEDSFKNELSKCSEDSLKNPLMSRCSEESFKNPLVSRCSQDGSQNVLLSRCSEEPSSASSRPIQEKPAQGPHSGVAALKATSLGSPKSTTCDSPRSAITVPQSYASHAPTSSLTIPQSYEPISPLSGANPASPSAPSRTRDPQNSKYIGMMSLSQPPQSGEMLRPVEAQGDPQTYGTLPSFPSSSSFVAPAANSGSGSGSKLSSRHSQNQSFEIDASSSNAYLQSTDRSFRCESWEKMDSSAPSKTADTLSRSIERSAYDDPRSARSSKVGDPRTAAPPSTRAVRERPPPPPPPQPTIEQVMLALPTPNRPSETASRSLRRPQQPRKVPPPPPAAAAAIW